jgi:cold shock CspA family protein
MPNATRLTGAILRLHRGFAILRSDTGDKFFAHASAFLHYDDISTAHVGDRVSFEPGPATTDLPQARGVRLRPEPEMAGTICHCSPDRGFALAVDQHSGQRLFVHASSMPRSQFEALHVGARIAFAAVIDGDRGPRAAGVVLLD